MNELIAAAIHTLFFIRICFIRISRLKFVKIQEYFNNNPEVERNLILFGTTCKYSYMF